MYNRESGIIGEAEALRYLTGQGMTVLEKNYRRAGGEIDLIVRDGDAIVFVEVKARRSPRFGAPAEAVTPAKMRHVVRAAMGYLQANRLLDSPTRFDVIAIDGAALRHIRGAFDATDLI